MNQKEYMEYEQYIDKFCNMEEKYGLFDLEVQGIAIWQLMRKRISNKIVREFVNFPYIEGKIEQKRTKKLERIYDSFREFIYHNQYFFGKRDLLFVNHPRKIYDNGRYVCKYTQELVEHTPYSYYILERMYQHRHLEGDNTKNLRYIGKEYIFLKLYKKKVSKDAIEQCIQSIQSAFKAEYSRIPKYVNDELRYHIELIVKEYDGKMKYYTYILKCILPKVVVLVDEYSGDNPYIILSAKQRGIITVGLQHSTIGRSHIAYNVRDQVGGQIKSFPDYFLTWTKKDTIIPQYPIPKDKIFQIGFPYLEKQKQTKLSNHQSREKLQVLFISGMPELAEYAVQLANNVDDSEVNVKYRLHPRELPDWEVNYACLVDSPVQVGCQYNRELIDDLLECDYVVCTGSSAAEEAVMLGVPTIIMKIGDYQVNHALIVSKEVYTVESIYDIIGIVLGNRKCGISETKIKNQGAICKFNDFIEELMQNNNVK